MNETVKKIEYVNSQIEALLNYYEINPAGKFNVFVSISKYNDKSGGIISSGQMFAGDPEIFATAVGVVMNQTGLLDDINGSIDKIKNSPTKTIK